MNWHEWVTTNMHSHGLWVVGFFFKRIPFQYAINQLKHFTITFLYFYNSLVLVFLILLFIWKFNFSDVNQCETYNVWCHRLCIKLYNFHKSSANWSCQTCCLRSGLRILQEQVSTEFTSQVNSLNRENSELKKYLWDFFLNIAELKSKLTGKSDTILNFEHKWHGVLFEIYQFQDLLPE